MSIFSSNSSRQRPKQPEKSDELLAVQKSEGPFLKQQKESYFENAKLIMDSINNNIFFNSNRLFENLVNNYSLAKKLLGTNFIRRLTGYDEKYIRRNMKIPEFREKLREKIQKKIEELKDEGLLDKENNITKDGYNSAAVLLVVEELNNIISSSEGNLKSKVKSDFGTVVDFKDFKGDIYKNISIRRSVRTALRRKHSKIEKNDLKAVVRKKTASLDIIYAIDASGSMKGEKLEQAKKAGVALAYKTLQDKNRIGLIIFREKVVEAVPLTKNFELIIKKLVRIRAKQQTNIAQTIMKATELLSKTKNSKHLIIITDLIPTKGQKPSEETLKAASTAAAERIRISIVGISLDEKAEKLARKIVELTSGTLYKVRNVKGLDKIILEEYDRID